MAKDEKRDVIISFMRRGDILSFKIANVDTDELRSYIVALWLVLDEALRLDMIRELAHYQERTDAKPPALSRLIADAYHATPEDK